MIFDFKVRNIFSIPKILSFDKKNDEDLRLQSRSLTPNYLKFSIFVKIDSGTIYTAPKHKSWLRVKIENFWFAPQRCSRMRGSGSNFQILRLFRGMDDFRFRCFKGFHNQFCLLIALLNYAEEVGMDFKRTNTFKMFRSVFEVSHVALTYFWR